MEETGEAALASTPHSLSATHGVSWISGGWGLFKQAPGMWITMLLVFIIGWSVLSLIPLVPLVLQLLLPVFTAGFMLGCDALRRGEALRFDHLIAAFGERTSALVGAGLLYLGLMLGVFAVVAILGFAMGVNQEVLDGTAPTANLALALLFLIGMLLFIPVIMGFYFSPCLLILHRELAVLDAFKLSIRGCLRNIIPFLVYSILISVLSVIALIPLGLGYLVLGPVVIAATYCAYREIFLDT